MAIGSSQRGGEMNLHALDEAVLPLRGDQGRLRLPPKAARTEGAPRNADGPLINRAKRTTAAMDVLAAH
jgi:hypothetical protein